MQLSAGLSGQGPNAGFGRFGYGAVRAGRHVVTAAGSVVLLAVLLVTALVVDDGSARELVKDIQPEDLLHAVRVAARGDALLAPSITRRLIERYVSQPPAHLAPGTGLHELTNREREAVALLARGLSNDQIADHMVISPLTAKTHLNRAMTKLHARDRAQLVVLAYESGLMTPPAPDTGGLNRHPDASRRRVIR
ncbi:response regulator transcription factor [Actinomadura scrupuli]|uniref:response regulator transcription factor n=1 Tax=Actinomadura scrupuli TaxID=559629 RepID=UPI003D968F04